MTFTRHNDGRGWRIVGEYPGRIEIEGAGCVRTAGKPYTMRTMVDDYSSAIRTAGCKFQLNVLEIMATIAKEATRIGGTFHRDPQSRRYEARLGEASVGLMQTLLSTARSVNEEFDLYDEVTETSLTIPQRSILLGAGYLAMIREDQGVEDPVKRCAAFNAGGVYDSDENEFRMRTYGPDRVLSFAKWWNDAAAVVAGVE